MRVFAAFVLIVAVAAQPPPPSTTPKPGFFHAIGDAIKSTASAVGHELESYVKEQGQNLLQNALPNLLGDIVNGGLSALLTSALTAGSSSGTSSKRDVTGLLNVLGGVRDQVTLSEQLAAGVGQDIEALLQSFLTGQVSTQNYLSQVDVIEQQAQDVIEGLSSGVYRQLFGVLSAAQSDAGNKRQILDVLGTATSLMQDVITQGQTVVSGLTDTLRALANPQNLSSLLGQLVNQVAGN